MGKLIAILFLSRDLAHRAHLQTTSYAQHMALGGFYESIIEIADNLAEMYQGRNGIIKDIPLLEEDELEDESEDESEDEKQTAKPAGIVKVLENHMDMVEEMRYSAVAKTDTPIQNKIDEVIGLYLSTIYKLKNLK
jgi:hypothetical protein